jgi:DNA processing protein
MTAPLSANTQAILLLTAPLIAARGQPSADVLTPAEYRKLARFLRDLEREPADLLDSGAAIDAQLPPIDAERLRRLLGRGFLLSQATERWQARSIWVVSRADRGYPHRLKARLKDHAPAILYGCGDAASLDDGGLAVVGSRHVDDELIRYAKAVGVLAATAERAIVSGGARGIDQAAMRGALEVGGRAMGVLADSLEHQVMHREHRDLLVAERLVLVSPYDPAAGFNVGNAMQRNKLIYALSDAALVVSAEHEKGGTWAGAVEQLDDLRLVPVYVRATGATGGGLAALHQKGARPWPDPSTPDALVQRWMSICRTEPPCQHRHRCCR